MKRIETDIEIDASPSEVWRILMDFASYPEWNPFIQRMAGDAAEGAPLEVFLQLPEGRGMSINPHVLVAKSDRELRWRGKVLVRGVFDGEHYFILEVLDGGRTRFLHGERFTGLLVPFFSGVIRSAAEGFKQMNVAFKERVERSHA